VSLNPIFFPPLTFSCNVATAALLLGQGRRRAKLGVAGRLLGQQLEVVPALGTTWLSNGALVQAGAAGQRCRIGDRKARARQGRGDRAEEVARNLLIDFFIKY
jgi:hypothetical protein